VSAVRQVAPDLTLLQISAPISSGSSGGPLLDETGRVIGVSTLYSIKAQNLNFGVPVEYLMKVMDRAGPATPLAKYEWPAAAAAGAIERAVPHHDEALLADCSAAELEAIIGGISGAIEVGAPLYNEGHHEACFRIYQGAALDLQKKMSGCTGGKRALAEGVERSSHAADYTAKAWAMRDTFDGLLDVIARRSAGAGSGGGKRKRDVPRHDVNLLKSCSVDQLAVVENAIISAIDVGAPLYNQGNIEACFRVYEGAILNLLNNDKKGCPAAKNALREGLKRAGTEKTYDDKAWAIRDSFDGVLDVIARRMGGT
jgi:hypothetical protein